MYILCYCQLKKSIQPWSWGLCFIWGYYWGLLKSHHFASKGPYSQSYGFSSNVQMWELDHKVSWALKNWCFWTVVLEKTLESPLDCKEIRSVNSKGNQPWIFNGRTDAEAETLKLWPSDAKSQFTGKTLVPGRIEGKRRRGGRGWFG